MKLILTENKRQFRLLLCFLLLLIISFVFVSNKEALAVDSKLPITIRERAGRTLLNYPVLVELNRKNFSFDNNFNIAFLDKNGNKLNYWIEKWDPANEEAAIWVKIPRLEAKQTETIYLVQKSDLTNESNGDETFEFFDDFNDNSIDQGKWMIINDECDQKECCNWGHCGNCCSDCKNAKVTEEEGFLKVEGAGNCCWCTKGVESKKTFSNFKIVARYRDAGDCWAWADKWQNSFMAGKYRGPSVGFERGEDKWIYSYKLDNKKPKSEVFDTLYNSNWHRIEIEKNNSQWEIKVDGRFRKSFSPITNDRNKIYFSAHVAEVASGCPGAAAYLDWVAVRDYVDPEPEVNFENNLVIERNSIAVVRKNNIFLVRGKILSTFKKDLHNVEIGVYNANPHEDYSQELERKTLTVVKAEKETEFEITIKVSSVKKKNPKILYLFLDPDNKIKESTEDDNLAKAPLPKGIIKIVWPLIASIILLSGFILLTFFLYRLKKIFDLRKEQVRSSVKTKHCLGCGMIIERERQKCPVCGSTSFENIN